MRPHFNNNKKKQGMVVNACHPSYTGSKYRRTVVQASLGKNSRPYLKNKVYSKPGHSQSRDECFQSTWKCTSFLINFTIIFTKNK
jgi:hypothetical protein